MLQTDGKKHESRETEHRVNTVYKLLSEGQSRSQIIQFCSEKWGVTDRTADQYMARAREKLSKIVTWSVQLGLLKHCNDCELTSKLLQTKAESNRNQLNTSSSQAHYGIDT